MNLADWVGSIGVFLILLAFYLNIKERATTKSATYLLLNIVGGALACMASILLNYIPFIILETIWVFVSVSALYKEMRK